MVAAAAAGAAGVDVEGYRDYRGVPVVGAWRWLDKYGFGLATEIDKAEAFLPLTILKRTFLGLLGLLVLSSIAIFVFTIMLAQAAAAGAGRDDRGQAARAVPAGAEAGRRRDGRRLQGHGTRCCGGRPRSSCSTPTR